MARRLKARLKVDPFNPASIQNAIDALSADGNWIQQKCDELGRRLAEIGLEAAQVAYLGAVADAYGDDNTDVKVRMYQTSTGYAIEAYGTDVFFVEFGTGVTAGNGYDTSEITPPVSIASGSYSQTVGSGQFTDAHPYWWYNGRRFIGTRPYMGMYHASKAIKENIRRVAEEVFA